MKKRNFNYLLFIGLFSLALASCSNSNNNSSSNNGSINTINKSNIISSADTDSSVSDDVEEYDFETISDGGSYIMSGDITSSIIVETKKEVTIVLDNCNITTDFAGIYIKKASKVYINLVGNNTIKCLNEFTQIDDNKVDGAIFSKDDLTIKGNGSLSIESIYHGIVAKDNLVITASNVSIKATKKGLDVNDYLVFDNSNININSETDAIHVENEDEELGYIYFDNSCVSITTKEDGISASGDIEANSSEFNISCNSTASISNTSINGIKGLDLVFTDCIVSIDSKDDAIHSNSNIEINSGTYNLASEDDGIHANNNLVINGGDITISNSYEGIESKTITINDGNINVTASDDGLNVAGGSDGSSFNRPGANNFNSGSSDAYITINGGVVIVDANGDGIDSNGNLYVNGGNIMVYGPTDNGNGALDYDGSASITGGSLCAIGYSGMAQNFSSGTQGSILYNLPINYSANITITLKDSSGNVIYSVVSKKSFNSIVISTSEIVSGGSYTLAVGSNSYSIAMSSLLYSNGSSGGNHGGNPGGGNPFGPRF